MAKKIALFAVVKLRELKMYLLSPTIQQTLKKVLIFKYF